MTGNVNINEKGHLTLGRIDSVELANQYGTPLYVMDEDIIRSVMKQYVDSVKKFYDGNGLICFASKAFSCKEIYRIANQEGLGTDVVSASELYTALSVNFPADKIIYHGNNKTNEELRYALESGVGRIAVDNIEELCRLSKIASEMNKTAKIMFRIKPGIDAHTHNFIMTGQIDSKFGFALETGEAMNAVKEALKLSNIKLVGVHCHIGSQIHELTPFVEAAKVMMKFIADVKKETGFEIDELNLGGGYGIRYTEEDDRIEYPKYMDEVSKTIHSCAKDFGIKLPFIMLEPGRSIVGEAGTTLYTVGAVKHIPDIRTYVSIDGGMADNPRYILYQSKYEFIVANKADKPKDTTVTVAGKCCETGDLLGENVPLQKCEGGDIMAVLSTGAYNYSMSSNYNRLPKPAVVMVKDGKSRVIVKRQSFEDIVRNDI